jgi:SAM-dependent methyltransferase
MPMPIRRATQQRWLLVGAWPGACGRSLESRVGVLGEVAGRTIQASGVPVALVQASGEAVPLTDTSVDIVVCDYGAMTFADPYRTVPEVARLLRPGGLFAFNTSSPLLELCWPDDAERAGDRLVRDYFGLHRLAGDDGMVSFQLPYGEWIRLFRSHGLEILDLIELRPAPDAVSSYRDDQERAWSPAGRMYLATAPELSLAA